MTTQTLVLRDSQICWIEKMPIAPDFKKLRKDHIYKDYIFFSGNTDKDIQKQHDDEVAAVIESAPQVSNAIPNFFGTLCASFMIENENPIKTTILKPGVAIKDRVPFEVTGWMVDKQRTCKWNGNRAACGNETCWDLNECQNSPEVTFYKLIPEQFGNTEQLKEPNVMLFGQSNSAGQSNNTEPLEPSQEESKIYSVDNPDWQVVVNAFWTYNPVGAVNFLRGKFKLIRI